MRRRQLIGRAAWLMAVWSGALIATALVGCREGSDASASSHGAGAALFQTYCAACHQADGAGSPDGRIPPLADSPWVSGPEDRIILIVLHGLRGRIDVKGQTYNVEMLAFGQILADEQIAAILTHVRRQFGEPSAPVTAERVARVRAETADRFEYWTVDELLAIPVGDAAKPSTPAGPSPPTPTDH